MWKDKQNKTIPGIYGRTLCICNILFCPQGTMNPSYQALIEAASDGFLSPEEIERFAPDTPSPDDVECYVDVETVSK